jgi:type IV pilus assembly protein PilC
MLEMDTAFPTFRRLLSFRNPFPNFLPRRTSRSQQRSLLRLILTATEKDIILSQLLDRWAKDESGVQRQRLHRLALLLHNGAALPDAVEEVRGVLGDEDVLGIRFGTQSGTLAASIRERLEQSDPALGYGSLPTRHLIMYLCLLGTVASAIITFWEIKIVPALNDIFREFDVGSPPKALIWSTAIANAVASYWYVIAAAVFAIWLLLFSRWPGRPIRLQITSRLFRPMRDLRIAEVLQKLSVATRAGRPLEGALSTLARYHFDPMLRHQLLFIRNELEQGANIWQSMGNVGLLNPQEVRVLESSERVGNRPWVLNQLAQLKKRRTTQRLANWSQLALPLVIILLGGFVLLQALSMFQSLLHIVYSLL